METDAETEKMLEAQAGGELEMESKEIFPVQLTGNADQLTVEHVKDQMERRTATPPEFQTLRFNGTKLEDNKKKLKDYGVKHGDKLDYTQ